MTRGTESGDKDGVHVAEFATLSSGAVCRQLILVEEAPATEPTIALAAGGAHRTTGLCRLRGIGYSAIPPGGAWPPTRKAGAQNGGTG
jgi:hypothetical protein